MTNPFSDAAAADYCLHAANFCYLASYLTRDMLWLRSLTCVGLFLGIVFFTCGSVPMFGPTAWQATFLVINVIQIGRLLRYRERVQLNAEEAALSEEAFEHLTRDELADLLTRSGRVGTRQIGEINVKHFTEGDLTEDERVLRDMAFSGLTRGDLLNLVTRRFHGTAYHLTPSRVRLWTERRKRRWSQWAAERAAKKAGREQTRRIPLLPPIEEDDAAMETMMPGDS